MNRFLKVSLYTWYDTQRPLGVKSLTTKINEVQLKAVLTLHLTPPFLQALPGQQLRPHTPSDDTKMVAWKNKRGFRRDEEICALCLPHRRTPLCVDWRYFIFQKLISLQPWGDGGGRGWTGGNAMTNWKINPSSLPFCGDRLASWRHFWPHFKVGSKVREPRNWPPKLARSKISATTDWLFKTWSQICKIKASSVCHRPISTPAWSSTGKHSQAVTCFKPLCIFTTPQPLPQSGLDRNPSKPSLGSSTRGPASRCECVKW